LLIFPCQRNKKKEKRKIKEKYTHYQTLVPTTPKLTCLLLLSPKKQKKGKKEKKSYKMCIYIQDIFRAVKKCQRVCRWVMRTAG
jgi:hypothetical protein